MSDFIVSDREDIESDNEVTTAQTDTSDLQLINARLGGLDLVPRFHGDDDAELIARSIRSRYRQMTEDSSATRTVLAADNSLGNIVAGAVRWVDAEITRDKQLDNSVRGEVSVCNGF